MKVKKIVCNIGTDNPEAGRVFYQDFLGLDGLMDMGWIQTYGAADTMPIQISMMTQGGSGTAVPDMSITVDDVDAAFKRAQEFGFKIEYGPVNEPWGVRRFYVRDPFGRLINILAHG